MSLLVVIPYRDRAEHLNKFIPHINKFLSHMSVHIIVVEQTSEKLFNRAKLLNIGFSYTQGKFNNYCFHDVDMLPLNADYSYCCRPTHLAVRCEQFGWELPYDSYFGGVTIFDADSFKKINGFSNEYWGWGAEDDDLLKRCQMSGIPTDRRNGRFKSLAHKTNIVQHILDVNQEKLKNTTWESSMADGLSTLNYKIKFERNLGCYTHVIVDV